MTVKKAGRGSKGKITFATPQSGHLRKLLVPEPIDDSNAEAPLDFTTLSSRGLGSQHSYWAVRHAHALFECAKISERLIRSRHDLRLEQSKFRAKNKGKYKNKYELDDEMALDSDIAELLKKVAVLEAQFEVVSALVQSYEGIRNAASREMFRRSTEMPSKD